MGSQQQRIHIFAAFYIQVHCYCYKEEVKIS